MQIGGKHEVCDVILLLKLSIVVVQSHTFQTYLRGN
jgi:hypothetical protein